VAGADWIGEAWAWVVASSLQATPLLVLAWAADRLLVRRVWPQLLLSLWLVALARFFVPPELGSPLSVTGALGEPTLAAAQLVPPAGALRTALALWLAGAAALVALRWLQRARLAARIEPCELPAEWLRALARLGGRRSGRVGTLPGLATPAVFGLLRPVLLLPEGWLARAPTRRDEHALLHELAHLERGDLWLDELCACVRALLWFHPLAWLAERRIHALGELACDQHVARALGGEARAYRDTLVLAARALLARPAPTGLRAFLGHPNALVVRIERLEWPVARARGLVHGVNAALLLVLCACVLPMAGPSAELRAQARRVLAAELAGLNQSCFTVHAAALVLAAEPAPPPLEE
jgi:beta-lactamase regulating signal transducer with metallopeptidase domain